MNVTYRKNGVLCLLVGILQVVSLNVCSQKIFNENKYFIEAEDFQFKGSWMISNEPGLQSGGSVLKSSVLGGKTAHPTTVINIRKQGNYYVWTRSRDYSNNNPGSRKYRLIINKRTMSRVSGIHGNNNYYWEFVGRVFLKTGENILKLKDINDGWARCDAIYITDTDEDPNKVGLNKLQNNKVSPRIVKLESEIVGTDHLVEDDIELNTLAELANEKIRLRFIEFKNIAGQKHIYTRASINVNGRWVDVNKEGTHEGGQVSILKSDSVSLNFVHFIPFWNVGKNLQRIKFRGGSEYVDIPDNPFFAGEFLSCIPVKVQQVSNRELLVEYVTKDKDKITGTWRLPPRSNCIQIDLSYKATKTGYYSFVVSAFNGIDFNQVKEVMLPPLFQYQRVPDYSIMIPSAATPQPVAIVEREGKFPLSSFITVGPNTFSQDWASVKTSPIGFSIKNSVNLVQPVAFSPILGLDDSKASLGENISRSFLIGIINDDWTGTLEYISDSVYSVKDYRSQKRFSLNDAIFNMIDLIKDDESSGWNPELKGFYDIEANPDLEPTVVQVAPAALVSAAVITDDEEFYKKRALPAIEYTLSRRNFRWSKALGAPFNQTPNSMLFNPYSDVFNTAYFTTLHQLLGEANPWIKNLALRNNVVRATSKIPLWTQELAAYRLTNDVKWLNKAVKNVHTFIKEEVYAEKREMADIASFYNYFNYPYWWDLIDLYEIYPSKEILDAANYSAFYTIAGLRSYPSVIQDSQVIHKNNEFTPIPNIWWKGKRKFRLGVTDVNMPIQEKKVWGPDVSPVGLGIEQPTTLVIDPAKPVWNIFMSSWSPHLLRLFQQSKRPIHEIYARNSIIGRFSNYPGYYASGFTDITSKPDFPYRGPDVSSIYYHHIPAQLSFSMDYLVTEAIQRSEGKINFQWGKQEGYVWFNNRIYGAGKGNILDDHNVKLWMKPDLIKIDRPEINYVTAISNNAFWIILLNEDSMEVQANISINATVPIKDFTIGQFYRSPNNAPEQATVNDRNLIIPTTGKGITFISIPLAKSNNTKEKSVQAVKEGMKVIDLGDPWGKLYTFRIRSPFGKDSFFAYLSTGPGKDISAEITIENHVLNDSLKKQYPFEWSLYPISQSETISMKVKLKSADTEKIIEYPSILPGIGK